MMHFLMIWSLSALGFIGLASSMSKHQKQLYGQLLEPKLTRLTQVSGWGLLIVAMFLSISRFDIANGISYWIGTLSFAALLIGLLLSYYAKKVKILAAVLILIFLVTCLFAIF